MAIIQPPAPFRLRGAKWRLLSTVQRNRSEWTKRSKGIAQPGADMWTVSGDFVTIVGADRALPWKAFYFALRGSANAFRVRAVEQQQTTAANPTARAGGTAGTTIPLQGLPASSTVLKAGMMMTVTLPSGHERLVGLVAPLVSNGQGQGTATFAPELGEIPAAGAAVEIQWPWALVNQSNEPPGWDVAEGQTYSFRVDAEEAL
ncbi:hypothetical protein [uncultured Sphingomonas sp.]|uniref:hypothetical protein n=1 Tax=uncultured Sphingomonas sp. TaxID=158754 RepID=UPI0025CF71F4|nr:hypothetical protein [uncultured Sphingomonas sp.]